MTPLPSLWTVLHCPRWTYSGMSRIYKHVTNGYHGPAWAARTSSFSSYPGAAGGMEGCQRARVG